MRRVLVLCALLVVCTPVTMDPAVFSREPPRGPIPADYFGCHYIAVWVSPAAFPAECGLYRLHGATPRWHMLHTAPGRWYSGAGGTGLARIESVLHFRDLYAPHAKVIYVLGGGGQVWSRTEWVAGAHSGYPDWVHPGIIADAWREHVRFLAQRFSGRIQYWEIWNEPSAGNWYTGNASLLAMLTQIAHDEIRAADPDAKIIGPSFTESGHEMMEIFYAYGGGQHIDIAGWHHGVVSPEADTAHILDAQRILRKYGVDKPLWVTEMNVRGGAAELMRTYLIHWLYGVESVAYYSWEMPSYGPDWPGTFAHTSNADGSLTEAGEAWLALREWLVGRSVVEWSAAGGQWSVMLSDSSVIRWTDSTMPVRVTS